MIVGIIWAIIFYLGLRVAYKEKFKVSMRGFAFLIPMFGLLVIMVIIFLGIEVYEYTESPEFCSKVCKSMEPYTATYLEPGNNTILDTHLEEEVICADCHNGPGFLGVTKNRIEGLGMVISELTGNYDPDEFKGNVPNEYCEKGGCHSTVDWKIEAISGEIFHPFTNNGTRSPETGESCTSCHNPRIGGTGLTKESCTVCHDITKTELKAHESRTCGQTTCHGSIPEVGHKPERPKEDACINCHNRKHPEDARVPFSVVNEYEREGVQIDLEVNNQFCSDCHKEQYDSFKEYSSGSCQDCHVEHKIAREPHLQPVDTNFDCTDCHIEIKTLHNPKEVTFIKFKDELENGFCSDCHTEEVNKFTEYNTGSCTDCHVDHDAYEPAHIKPTAEYDECNRCHYEFDQKHNLEKIAYEKFPAADVDNKLCSSCHFDEYTAFTEFKSGSCTSCHDTHKKPEPPHNSSVSYSNCENCHVGMEEMHEPKIVAFSTFPIDDFSNEFCSSCHDSQVETYTTYNTGKCINCHTEHDIPTPPHPNQAPYDDCDKCHSDLGAKHNLENETFSFFPVSDFGNEFCSSCHNEQYTNYTAFNTGKCLDCHTEHAKPVPDHPTTAPFEDCRNCHVLMEERHDPSVVLFKEFPSSQIENGFCSVCHDSEYNAYTMYATPEDLEFYGGCTSCHDEHGIKRPPHRISEPYDNCKACHSTYDEDIKTHNPTGIDYEPIATNVGNGFCSDCHNDEYTLYSQFNSGTCTDCHTKHAKPFPDHLTEVPYDNCSDCHYEMPEKHNPSMVSYNPFPALDVENEFCSICHNDEYNTFTQNATQKLIDNYGGCTDCHDEHRVKNYPHRTTGSYGACGSCHSKYDTDITIHNPTGIDYQNFTSSISQEFCSDCHSREYDSLKDTTDPNKKHSTRDCTDCHSKHREILVDFSKCAACHAGNFPVDPVHNDKLNTCRRCHDVTKVIHIETLADP